MDVRLILAAAQAKKYMIISSISQSLLSPPIVSEFFTVFKTANIVKDFFKDLYFYPEKHMNTVMFFGAVTVGSITALLYAIRKVYQRHCP